MAERVSNKAPAKPFLSKAPTDGKTPSEATPVTDKDRFRFRYKYNGNNTEKRRNENMPMSRSKWLLKKIKGINHERLNKHLDVMVKNTGKSRTYIKWDIFKNFLTTGCSYTDYFRGDYINLTKEQKKTFVTAKKFYNIIHYFNDQQYIVLLHDKLVFDEYFKDFIKRDFYNLRTGSIDGFKNFLNGKDIVFAKDPTGECGHNISKIKVAEHTPEELFETCKKNGQLLVEEAIIQSDDMNEVNPYSVNSYRVVTLLKDGKAQVIANALRVNQNDATVVGCSDDIYFAMKPDGSVDGNVVDDYGNIYTKHPLTGFEFANMRIKGVKEAFDLCCKAAEKIPQVRYIGWDIAFSDKGPVIVEGNEYPGFGVLQFYKLKDSHEGHLKDIEKAVGDEIYKIKM